MKTTRRILIVNRRTSGVDLLRRSLEERKIQVTLVNGNGEGLERILMEEEPYDVIVIGNAPASAADFEVCRRLQEDKNTAQKPLLFATEKKIEGPPPAVEIDVEETLARVQGQVDLLETARENKELRNRLEESRSTAALGVASLAVTHNINNFLGVVVGYMELLKMNCDHPPKVLQYHDTIEQAHSQIITLLQSLAAMGHSLRRYPHVQVDLPDLFAHVAVRLRRKIGIQPRIELSVPDARRQLSTHPEVLENILLEVLVNAWESYENVNDSERVISIAVEMEEQKREAEAPILVIAVSDHGKGLGPSIMEDPFAPFATTKGEKGAGMGLTGARYSIRRLGGELSLHENPEGGVTAEIHHPL